MAIFFLFPNSLLFKNRTLPVMERLLIWTFLGSTKCFLSAIHRYKPYFSTITVTEAALYIYLGLNTQISEQSL